MFSLSPKSGCTSVDSYAYPLSPSNRTLRRGVKCPPKRKGLGEKLFLEQVQNSDGFWRALGSLSKMSGMNVDELHGFAEDVCKCCWTEAGQVMLKEDPARVALAEVDRLKEKLSQCNLAALKQMAAVKANAHMDGQLGEDTIAFYEPLQYLDESTKELILTIVNEKLRLIDKGHAPPSLVDALTRNANAQAHKAENVDAGEVKELRAELEDMKLELKRTKGRLQEAQTDALQWKVKLEEAEAGKIIRGALVKLLDAQPSNITELVTEVRAAVQNELRKCSAKSEVAFQKEVCDAIGRAEKNAQAIREWEAEVERQQTEIARQAAEIDRQREELEHMAAELEREREANAQLRIDLELERQANAALRIEVTRLAAELDREREVNAELRAEVLRLQEFVKLAEKLERELNALQERFNALEAEADAMREELARRNNTRTQGTQTSLTGTKLDEQAADNRRLKMIVQEMQEKFKELMEKCRRKGIGKEMTQIAEDLGLQEMLKENTVFQRLYDDAIHRVHRLEKLREKVRKEQQRSFPNGAGLSPRTSAAMRGASNEIPVQEAIDESPLTAMRRLVQDREVASVPSTSAEGDFNYRAMKSSSSLPVLPAAQNQSVSVLNMDLHGRPRNSRMRHS